MMESRFGQTAPTQEGVFGPEIVLNAVDGGAQVLFPDGRIMGTPPAPPTTNGFLVWLTAPVIVISEGVSAENVVAVAGQLRRHLELEEAPVIFSMGSVSDGMGASVVSDVSTPWPRRELARAEAYVLVQCAWVEAERLRIQVDDEEFVFEVNFEGQADGSYLPRVR